MIRQLLKVELILIQISSALEVVFVGWTTGIENVVKNRFVSHYHPKKKTTPKPKTQPSYKEDRVWSLSATDPLKDDL